VVAVAVVSAELLLRERCGAVPLLLRLVAGHRRRHRVVARVERREDERGVLRACVRRVSVIRNKAEPM
jgi:hypothetical protein